MLLQFRKKITFFGLCIFFLSQITIIFTFLNFFNSAYLFKSNKALSKSFCSCWLIFSFKTLYKKKNQLSLQSQNWLSLKITDHEKNVSTVRKKKKKQTRFQKSHGYKKWTPSSCSAQTQRKKKINCFWRTATQALSRKDMLKWTGVLHRFFCFYFFE